MMVIDLRFFQHHFPSDIASTGRFRKQHWPWCVEGSYTVHLIDLGPPADLPVFFVIRRSVVVFFDLLYGRPCWGLLHCSGYSYQ